MLSIRDSIPSCVYFSFFGLDCIFSFAIYWKLYCAFACISLIFAPPALSRTPVLVTPALKDFLAMFISLLSDILRVHDSAYCPSDRGNLPVQYNPVRLYSVYRTLKAVQMLYWIR